MCYHWGKLTHPKMRNKPQRPNSRRTGRGSRSGLHHGRRTIKPELPLSEGDLQEGLVISTSAGRCLVKVGGQSWMCGVRGRLKQGSRAVQTLVIAGDRVMCRRSGSGPDRLAGVVEEVLPRRNKVSRQAAARSGGNVEQVLVANLDQVVAVQSLTEPTPQSGFMDRVLVAAERYAVAGILVLNKTDLASPAAADRPWTYFAQLGYRVIRTSAADGTGLPELSAVLAGKISIMLGASGVGKSSLLNAIQPGLGLRVAAVTGKTGLGRHTTTRTELYPLEGGGYLADSPGLRGLLPWDIAPEALRDYFPEFRQPAGLCRYRTCLHRDEPDCGVKQEVAAGAIPGWRHEVYLSLVRELEDRRRRLGFRR